MPEGTTDAQKDAVASAVMTTFDNLIRNLWVLCGSDTIAGDETESGKIIRAGIVESLGYMRR